MKKTIVQLVFLLFTLNLYAQPGTLDPFFGIGGKVTTPIGPIQAYAYDMALMSNGDIVMVGEIWNYALSWDFAVAKYKSDGSLDVSFGNGGTLHHGSALSETFKAVCIQPDGKILAAGYCGNPYYDFVIIRYLTNGTIDTSFGIGGLASTSFGSQSYALCYDMGIQSDGKIVLGGYASNGSDTDFALARFDSSGTIDSSFGNNGTVLTPMLNYYDKAYSVNIQPDGKILLVGSSETNKSFFSAARYNYDGSLDNTFGINGKLTHNFLVSSFANTSALQSNGKIIIAGFAGLNFAMARYNSNGILDSSFGNAGIVSTNIYISQQARAYGISIQPNGNILLCGWVNTGSDTDFGVVRYDSTGVLDPSFGSSGIVTTSFDTYMDWPFSVVIQPDGKILVGGWSGFGSNGAFFALARYLGEIVSVNELQGQHELLIYPNPAIDKITINCNEIQYQKLQIINMLGECVLQKELLNNINEINISTLYKGIYTINLTGANWAENRKLIIN